MSAINLDESLPVVVDVWSVDCFLEIMLENRIFVVVDL